jgi:hypothetical protein
LIKVDNDDHPLQARTPRDALIKVLGDIMAGDFGHTLPDSEFWADVDRIIARLADEGFVIAEAEGRQITLAFDRLIGPIRFDAGTYRILRVDDARSEALF